MASNYRTLEDFDNATRYPSTKRQCAGKEAHDTKAQADAHSRRLVGAHSYFCGLCKHWHVGH